MRSTITGAQQGCLILQPYDMRMGAGTFHTATTLRALGPEPWNAAFVQPSPPADRRPLWRKPQPAAALLPVSGDPEAEPAGLAGALSQEPGSDRHRSAEARYPLRGGRLGKPHAGRLGAGLGSVVRRDGSHPVHLFPADGRVRLQAGGGRADLRARTARDVYPGRRQRLRPRVQRSVGNGQALPTATCSSKTRSRCRNGTSRSPIPTRCSTCSPRPRPNAATAWTPGLPIAAYEQAIEASHLFNLLQARGVISVQERASYMGRVRDLARGACEAYMAKMTRRTGAGNSQGGRK